MKRLSHSYPSAYPTDIKSKKSDPDAARSPQGIKSAARHDDTLAS